MPYYLTKILPLIVMPLTITWVLAIAGFCFVLAGKRRPSIWLLSLSILVLWASSAPIVAYKMMWSLEKQYPPVALRDIPVSDCIIVLGGVVGAIIHPRVDIELYDSIDRVYQAARLFRNGKAKAVIVAAGNQPWAIQEEPEAERIKRLLIEWGVAQEAIFLESSSKNTRENALNSFELTRKLACNSNLLITTAWHMPRAAATFQKAGMNVLPIPVDIQGAGDNSVRLLSFLPDSGTLGATGVALREWLGIWVYRWRGWN